MSAAFDVVDHRLLLKKVSAYGFQEDVVAWLESYLNNRAQAVSINGDISELINIQSGVPQGSILGPLLYTLYTNELPEVIFQSNPNINPSFPQYNTGKGKNESLCCFADDTTFTSIHSDHTVLSQNLENQYKIIAEFLTDNGLKVNDDKTHLVVVSNGNSRAKSQSANLVEIRTPSKTIRPTNSEKLLGCWIEEDLKWNNHIRESDDNLVKSLSQRVTALKRITKVCSFKTRKMIANGIFLSKLSYLITVWSNCSKDMMKSLQAQQNKVARYITRNNWETRTITNFNQVSWLLVR